MKNSTTALSDLPLDLVEKVICRVPLTSLRAVRTTCKNWNGLFTHRRSFTKKHIRKSRAATKKREFMAIMRINASVDLMSFNLRGLENDDDVETFINRKGKFINLNDGDGVDDIYSVSHCSGLLLCTTRPKNSRLMVLNPYRGQTRGIEPIDHECDMDSYVLGYEKKNMKSHRCHKILRSMEMTSILKDDIGLIQEVRRRKYQIYNFNSDSWKDIHPTPNRHLRFYTRDVSLKGNTYWLVRWDTKWCMPRPPRNLPLRDCMRRPPCNLSLRKSFRGRVRDNSDLLLENRLRMEERVRETRKFFLLCFDFTRERFGPPLDLPFDYRREDSVSLSSVREKQLALLWQRSGTLKMEIWISNKIEPEAVSWSKLFVAVNLKTRLTTLPFEQGSFFVDKGKKVVVVFDRDLEMHWVAYIIGEDGCFKKVVFGEYINKHGCPAILCPYVPSSVQIKQATPRGNHVD